MATKRQINMDPIDAGIQREADAESAIRPGDMVELISGGNIQKQSTASADQPVIVAMENYLEGEDLSDSYAAGDIVLYRAYSKGQKFNAILSDGESVVVGDDLEFGSVAGELRKYTSGTKVVEAAEIIDASNSATTVLADRRIAVIVK